MKAILKLTLLLVIILFNSNCKKEDCVQNPDCLYSKIEEIVKLNYAGNAGITEYSFQNQNVFYIDPGVSGIPDQAFDVINTNCVVIGQLKGVANNTVINGEDFYKNAKLIKVLWER